MDELLQAFDVSVVKESLLKVRSGAGLSGGALRRRHGHIARGGHLELTIDSRSKLYPGRVRVWRGSGSASQEIAEPQISDAEGEGIRREAERVRHALIVNRISRIEGHPFIGR